MQYSEFLRLIRKRGAKLVLHGKEHDLYKLGDKTTRVPRHSSEIPKGTLNKMLKDLGINKI